MSESLSENKVPDYTLVTGTDRNHIEQLCLVWDTWKYHKPSLLQHPMILFVDRDDRDVITLRLVSQVIDHPNLSMYYWPPREGITYPHIKYDKDSKDKFGQSQRYKMMAGFVHIPATYVDTPYWLKLDSDVVATGKDNWINPKWFDNDPDIVGHRWGFTKPASFPEILDDWYANNWCSEGSLDLPLDSPDSERISHPRISSWCSFFSRRFTRLASFTAEYTCGEGMLPVPSQDTYMWYLSKRLFGDDYIVRTNMKDSTGFTYRSNPKSVESLVKESLQGAV